MVVADFGMFWSKKLCTFFGCLNIQSHVHVIKTHISDFISSLNHSDTYNFWEKLKTLHKEDENVVLVRSQCSKSLFLFFVGFFSFHCYRNIQIEYHVTWKTRNQFLPSSVCYYFYNAQCFRLNEVSFKNIHTFYLTLDTHTNAHKFRV